MNNRLSQNTTQIDPVKLVNTKNIRLMSKSELKNRDKSISYFQGEADRIDKEISNVNFEDLSSANQSLEEVPDYIKKYMDYDPQVKHDKLIKDFQKKIIDVQDNVDRYRERYRDAEGDRRDRYKARYRGYQDELRELNKFYSQIQLGKFIDKNEAFSYADDVGDYTYDYKKARYNYNRDKSQFESNQKQSELDFINNNVIVKVSQDLKPKIVDANTGEVIQQMQSDPFKTIAFDKFEWSKSTPEERRYNIAQYSNKPYKAQVNNFNTSFELSKENIVPKIDLNNMPSLSQKQAQNNNFNINMQDTYNVNQGTVVPNYSLLYNEDDLKKRELENSQQWQGFGDSFVDAGDQMKKSTMKYFGNFDRIGYSLFTGNQNVSGYDQGKKDIAQFVNDKITPNLKQILPIPQNVSINPKYSDNIINNLNTITPLNLPNSTQVQQRLDYIKSNPQEYKQKMKDFYPDVPLADKDIQTFNYMGAIAGAQFIPYVNVGVDSYLVGSGVHSGYKALTSDDPYMSGYYSGQAFMELTPLLKAPVGKVRNVKLNDPVNINLNQINKDYLTTGSTGSFDVTKGYFPFKRTNTIDFKDSGYLNRFKLNEYYSQNPQNLQYSLLENKPLNGLPNYNVDLKVLQFYKPITDIGFPRTNLINYNKPQIHSSVNNLNTPYISPEIWTGNLKRTYSNGNIENLPMNYYSKEGLNVLDIDNKLFQLKGKGFVDNTIIDSYGNVLESNPLIKSQTIDLQSGISRESFLSKQSKNNNYLQIGNDNVYLPDYSNIGTNLVTDNRGFNIKPYLNVKTLNQNNIKGLSSSENTLMSGYSQYPKGSFTKLENPTIIDAKYSDFPYITSEVPYTQISSNFPRYKLLTKDNINLLQDKSFKIIEVNGKKYIDLGVGDTFKFNNLNKNKQDFTPESNSNNFGFQEQIYVNKNDNLPVNHVKVIDLSKLDDISQNSNLKSNINLQNSYTNNYNSKFDPVSNDIVFDTSIYKNPTMFKSSPIIRGMSFNLNSPSLNNLPFQLQYQGQSPIQDNRFDNSQDQNQLQQYNILKTNIQNQPQVFDTPQIQEKVFTYDQVYDTYNPTFKPITFISPTFKPNNKKNYLEESNKIAYQPVVYDNNNNEMLGDLYSDEYSAIVEGQDYVDNSQSIKMTTRKISVPQSMQLKNSKKNMLNKKFLKKGNNYVERRYYQYDKPNENKGSGGFNTLSYVF